MKQTIELTIITANTLLLIIPVWLIYTMNRKDRER